MCKGCVGGVNPVVIAQYPCNMQYSFEGHGELDIDELKILPALIRNNIKIPLLIYGLLRACSKLTGGLMAVSSPELIEASPLITVGAAGQSPEWKMPARSYLSPGEGSATSRANFKQCQARARPASRPQRAQLSRQPAGASKPAGRHDRAVLFSEEALVRAQAPPASLLNFYSPHRRGASSAPLTSWHGRAGRGLHAEPAKVPPARPRQAAALLQHGQAGQRSSSSGSGCVCVSSCPCSRI